MVIQFCNLIVFKQYSVFRYYAEPYNISAQYLPRIAGFYKHFLTGKISLDLLTVKGAGHFVPLDRPGKLQSNLKCTDF
jgi:pimeloyl-ACP methyl ester carboxylesterase